MRSSMFYLLVLFFVSQSQSCTEAKANVQNSEDSIGTPVANYDFGAQLFSSDFTDVEVFLSDIKKRHEGKTIILDLWGTSCPPCLKDFSNSHEIKKELIAQDVVIVYLCAGRSSKPDKWHQIVQEMQLVGDHIYLDRASTTLFMDKYGFRNYPNYVVIDKDGNENSKMIRGVASINVEQFITKMQ